MNVTCTQCQMKIGIEDAKVPSSPFSIKCPRCRETITVKPPPKEEPRLDARGRPSIPGDIGNNPDAMSLLSELFQTMANRGAGELPRAWSRRNILLCHNDEAVRTAMRGALDEQRYELHVADTAVEALAQLKETKDDIIVLDPQFDQSKQGGVGMLQHVNGLTPNYRRRMYLVLVSPQLKTLDAYLAFVNGVNLTVNTEDVSQFQEVLERSVRDFNELYHPFNQAAGLAAF
ncbi:MAG TPA: zinc-ribbon domain-containing protein [Blastocatellia bacterium]|nr:zinc-ribbon domain-containing protein [Blastocatellia bacterium]